MLDVDWAGLYQDWRSSNLSKSSYVQSTRLHRFVRSGRVPTPGTVLQHLKLQEVREGSSAVSVHCLTPQEVQSALTKESRKAKNASRVLHPVFIALPNGARIQFESDDPERFVLQALKIGGQL